MSRRKRQLSPLPRGMYLYSRLFVRPAEDQAMVQITDNVTIDSCWDYGIALTYDAVTLPAKPKSGQHVEVFRKYYAPDWAAELVCALEELRIRLEIEPVGGAVALCVDVQHAVRNMPPGDRLGFAGEVTALLVMGGLQTALAYAVAHRKRRAGPGWSGV